MYDIRIEHDQFIRVFPKVIGIAARPAVFDGNVLTDGPTQMLETLNNAVRRGFDAGSSASVATRTPTRRTRSLCCARRKRPCCRCCVKKTDKLAPPHHRPEAQNGIVLRDHQMSALGHK